MDTGPEELLKDAVAETLDRDGPVQGPGLRPARELGVAVQMSAVCFLLVSVSGTTWPPWEYATGIRGKATRISTDLAKSTESACSTVEKQIDGLR